MKTSCRLLTVLFLIAMVTLIGCSKKSADYYKPEGQGIAGSQSGKGYGQENGVSEVELLDSTGASNLFDDSSSEEYKLKYGRSTLPLLPVYFDFDSETIRDDQRDSLEKNAGYLKENPSVQIRIEGNSDSSGTNEYNMALGERRAINTKNYLTEIGIEEYRLRTVSYGEERPLFEGTDDFSMQQNRRADFVIE